MSLLAECVRGEEGIDFGFSFAISALSTDAGIALKSLIGQPALLELLTANSRDKLRPFHGHITGVELSGSNGGLARYQLTVEPWTAFLARGRDSRVFQDMSVIDILDAVFASWHGRGRLAPAWRFDLSDPAIYARRSLTTQYQESDLTFVRRLMLDEGLFFYFEHAGDTGSDSLGVHTLVIADHNGSFRPNSQSRIQFSQSSAVMKTDNLDRWRTEKRRTSTVVELTSWDYRMLNNRDAGGSTAEAPAAAQLVVREPLGAYAYESREQGQRRADNLAQALAVRQESHVGAGTVRTLAPGTTFVLDGHAQYNDNVDDGERTFVVLRALHLMHNNLSAELKSQVSERLAPSTLVKRIEADEAHSMHAVGRHHGERPLYRVRIDAIRTTIPYRSSRLDERGALIVRQPTIRGQQTAIVVGPPGSVIHTDRDHRVKVQFHWQRGGNSHSRLEHPSPDGHTGAPGDDTAGTWVRVSTAIGAIAGANWGSNAMPRVGQEVLVDFIDGDIDRPVVVGGLYNGSGSENAQGNNVGMSAGAATGNAPAWFAGGQGAHAHPAVLSGFKSQAIASTQSGTGAYNQLVFDDSAGQSRVALQRHAAAHSGTDELNLGQLHHQTDNARLAPAGFGAELKTEHNAALRAGLGMLLSAQRGTGDNQPLLNVETAIAQNEHSLALQKSMATTALKHNAMLPETGHAKGGTREELAAIAEMSSNAEVLRSTVSGTSSDGGAVPGFTEPLLQLTATSGIAAATPSSAILSAARTTSIMAGHDINLLAQTNLGHGTAGGISLFTYGKADAPLKPNAECGIKLHAATGSVSVQSQSGPTKLTSDRSLCVASTHAAVNVSGKAHVLLTAQGASIKLAGGNIQIHAPGKVSMKASMKSLTGPATVPHSRRALPVPGELNLKETPGAHSVRFASMGSDTLLAEAGWTGHPFKIQDGQGKILASGVVGDDGRLPRVTTDAAIPLILRLGDPFGATLTPIVDEVMMPVESTHSEHREADQEEWVAQADEEDRAAEDQDEEINIATFGRYFEEIQAAREFHFSDFPSEQQLLEILNEQSHPSPGSSNE